MTKRSSTDRQLPKAGYMMAEIERPTVTFKKFESMSKSWENLCGEAAQFASSLETGQLISVSHSQEGVRGLVVVWYRE